LDQIQYDPNVQKCLDFLDEGRMKEAILTLEDYQEELEALSKEIDRLMSLLREQLASSTPHQEKKS
jgi:hypothetical protein